VGAEIYRLGRTHVSLALAWHLTKQSLVTKSAGRSRDLSFNIAHAEGISASHGMSSRRQVFTDLSKCAKEEHSSGIYCFGFNLN
jgi:hypothetical protein